MTIKCLECGVEGEARRKSKKYCSERCRNVAWQKVHRIGKRAKVTT